MMLRITLHGIARDDHVATLLGEFVLCYVARWSNPNGMHSWPMFCSPRERIGN
jgi:hypothetical protein